MPLIPRFLRNRVQRLARKAAAVTFRYRMPKRLWDEHASWLATCKGLSRLPLPADDAAGPVFALSQRLRRESLDAYRDKYAKRPDLRVLIHLPPAAASMGGNSLFSNWLDGLRYMGVPCEPVETGQTTNNHIERFKPTVFFTSDHVSYLRWIDWPRLRAYRERRPMALVLTASAEHDGNTPARPRLKLARERGVDFFVSFREAEYITEHLSDWTREGFDVLSIPFSANPTGQFHVPFEPKPLDYVFLASINPEKAPRYWAYFSGLLPKYRGVINGPGWGQDGLMLARPYHPYMYALGAVGINLHVPISLNLLTEINERTFILACCGAFQLCDAPQVLRRFFPETAVPSATSPAEYSEKFAYYLKQPDARMPFQLESLKAVYAGHTIFHRMTIFLERALTAIGTSGAG